MEPIEKYVRPHRGISAWIQAGGVPAAILLVLIAASVWWCFFRHVPRETAGISGEGYLFAAPEGWRVERITDHALAAYPNSAAAGSSSGTCKIEMAVFPYASGTDAARWIAARVGADPSLAVAEVSRVALPVQGGTAVRWKGAIDGAPTELVYAFNSAGNRAYEIAASPLNGTSSGNASCAGILEAFVSRLMLR